MTHRDETASPFFELVDASGDFSRFPMRPETCERLQGVILQCRTSAGRSHARMEELGVSSDLVFRLDLVIAQLGRIDEILQVQFGGRDVRLFAAMLVRACAEERGIQVLLRNSTNRVARQIVTHTGKSGEHYIAASKSDWLRMGWESLGAGAITAFTALFKYMFVAMALAPLWVGVAHSLNYTLSFAAMQFLGWKLASKMPSMTAAALCDAMEQDDGMQSEVRLVAAITRTQLIVTVGNLLGAIPVAVLIDHWFQWTRGHPFLTQEAALHGLKSMNPLASMTLLFAALTGCFLWVSSLFAGWTANWMVLNRLPAAIAQSRRIGRFFGFKMTVELALIVERHLSGVAGYACLGLLLGLLPFISVFAGVPVEVRHITLASASMAYDVSSLVRTGSLHRSDLFWASIGLLATGVLNFSVSFALGLWLAVRARNLDTRGRIRLVAALGREFRSHPARFLWRHELEPVRR
jgi:site-specific recombinase